jgi:hypothetical protein
MQLTAFDTVDLINGVVFQVNAEIVNIPRVLTAILLPLITEKTIKLVSYVETLLNERLTCREISQDLYGLGNSFCTVATRGLDARWLSSLVMAVCFLVSIPIWICAANGFYDPEQREWEERELAQRRQSRGRKSLPEKKTGKKGGAGKIQGTAEY